MNEKLRVLFGEMLIADKVIQQAQLEEALSIQKKQAASGKEVQRIGVILANLGYLDKVTLEEYINKVILQNF